MPLILTDVQINALIVEVKPLPDDYPQSLQTRQKRGHRERDIAVDGADGNKFRMILRQAALNPLDFSVILAWMPPQSTSPFRLCRFNGKSHEHTNKLELQTFYDFHIHRATERYQLSGLREDAFAQPTTRYQSFESAYDCLIEDCRFQLPPNQQYTLFDAKGEL